MAYDPSLDRYQDLQEFWSLPEEQIEYALRSLTGMGEHLFAPILIHGIYLKHPMAQWRAEFGGRKIAGHAMLQVLAHEDARARLNEVLRCAVLGDTDADPRWKLITP